MRVVAIIPARMASSRFPGKPLAPILGRPMIEHVYRRASMSDVLDEVYVATCDQEIQSVVTLFDGKAIMTSLTHERGTDRIAEAAATLGLDRNDIVVNVQGDEPLLHPDMLRLAVEPLLQDPQLTCTNLYSPITSEEEVESEDEIKVVPSLDGHALYMSRAPVPSNTRCLDAVPHFRQVCIIGFRYALLQSFHALPQTPLERAESIDMLRLIEHGTRVRLVSSPYRTRAVDTPKGIGEVEALMASDPVAAMYLPVASERRAGRDTRGTADVNIA